MKQLEEIKARVSAASRGPWGAAVSADRKWALVLTNSGTEGELRVARCADDDDAEFIAAARTDVPKLVAALEGVEDVLTWLDMVEEVHPSSAPPGSLNVSAAGTAAVIRKAIRSALEAA